MSEVRSKHYRQSLRLACTLIPLSYLEVLGKGGLYKTNTAKKIIHNTKWGVTTRKTVTLSRITLLLPTGRS